MNTQTKPFRINRIWTRINAAHTVVWLHRNPMTARQKKVLLRELARIDPDAKFFWTTSHLAEQLLKQNCTIAPKDVNYLRTVSEGPTAVLLFSRPTHHNAWKWIINQKELIVLAAQIASSESQNSTKTKHWYSSQDVSRLVTLRSTQVYSELLGVLQVPVIFSCLLSKHTSRTNDTDPTS